MVAWEHIGACKPKIITLAGVLNNSALKNLTSDGRLLFLTRFENSRSTAFELKGLLVSVLVKDRDRALSTDFGAVLVGKTERATAVANVIRLFVTAATKRRFFSRSTAMWSRRPVTPGSGAPPACSYWTRSLGRVRNRFQQLEGASFKDTQRPVSPICNVAVVRLTERAPAR